MNAGDQIQFHPEENPNTIIKGEVLKIFPKCRVYVEVLNETHPVTGKRMNWHATDLCGATAIVHESQIIKA